MLHGAAAAMGEVPAHRSDAVGARRHDGDETGALAMNVRLHPLTGQRVGHEHRARGGIGDTVALGSEAGDVERLSVTHRAAHR